jgi:hypothetical protein
LVEEDMARRHVACHVEAQNIRKLALKGRVKALFEARKEKQGVFVGSTDNIVNNDAEDGEASRGAPDVEARVDTRRREADLAKVRVHRQPEVTTGRLDAVAALVELEDITGGYGLTAVHESFLRIYENVRTEFDTEEGGNHVERNKTETKDARNGEENFDRRGAGSGSPRMKNNAHLRPCVYHTRTNAP